MEDANRGAPHQAPDAEMRLATIVKCDIVDSTRIWSKLDPSDGLALTRSFKKAVEEVVKRHGGYVERWEGDGALILFGYPDALEDAPENAVRAGLELVEAVRSVRVADAKLEIRVGIASGSIAVDLTSRTLDGLEFNMAERLKAIAEPGCVVIADSTKRLTKNFFEYDDLGMRQAKGFDQGLRVWRVMRESAVFSRFEAQRFDDSLDEIIGRAAELATLADCWTKSRDGRGQVVLLVGDAGMGKSRLARAVLDWASRDSSVKLEIDCTPSTRNSPLFPVGVLLRRAAQMGAATSETEKSDLAKQLLARFLQDNEVADALNYLAPLFGLRALPIPSDKTPEQVQEQTISTVVRMLRALAAQGALTVLCEDLHWADDTTAKLVQRIAEDIADLPTMMIVTSRSKSDTSLDVKKFETFCKEITLGPLPGPAAADLVRSVAKGAVLSADLIQGIVGRCEGVPLILEEVTRGTLETVTRGEAVNFDAASRGAVPAPLQLVVESRLERWQQHKPIVQAASVLGREFSIGVLQQMLPAAADNVVNAINMLADHGLFAERAASASDRARFTHAMIRDAVYQTLLRDDRRWFHSQAADTLNAKYQGTPDASPEVVAQHLCEATRFGEAIEIRLAASGDTVARGAYVETEGHCEAALKLIDEIKSAAKRRELQFKLLVQLGVALTGRHGYSAPQVENAYRRAREVCGETAEAAMLYPIMRGLTALALVRGNLATGYELSLQSMEIAEQSRRAEFRIDAMSVHCYATMYYRSLEECRSWIKRCLELYREEGGEKLTYPVPNDAATAALAILPTIEWLLGDSQAAEDAISEGLAHAERCNRDFDKAYVHAWRAGVRFTQRRYAESEEYAQKTLEIAQKNGFGEWYVTGLLIGLLAQASLRAAPEALKSALDTCMKLAGEGVGLNASWYLWALARGNKLAGNAEFARQLIEQAFMRAKSSGETRMDAELLISKAELEPDAASAIQLLSSALSVADEQGAVANSLRAAAMLVLRSGRDAAALELAGATLELLDGRGDYPPQRGWMQERLATLRRSLKTTPTIAERA